MKALLLSLVAMLLVTVGSSTARAQYPPCPPVNPWCCPVPPPRAPDAMGPGYPAPNCYGQWYSNQYVYPSFSPFQGVLPIPSCPNQQGGGFPSHPFARSPRDFFMKE
jgi:hypothetical protein